MATLTLRLSEQAARTVERLKRMTGEKTAAKALMVAARIYEARHMELERQWKQSVAECRNPGDFASDGYPIPPPCSPSSPWTPRARTCA